jgi:Cu/Ag efflux protein CusF
MRPLVFLLVLFAFGCRDESFDLYQTRGEVVALKPEIGAVTVFHEDVPGFMDSMQMDFAVADVDQMSGLTPGDRIAFTIAVSHEDGETTIRDIQPLPEATTLDLNKPEPPALDSLLLDSLRLDSLRLDSLRRDSLGLTAPVQ